MKRDKIINGASAEALYNKSEDVYEAKQSPFDITVTATRYKSKPRKILSPRFDINKWKSANTQQMTAGDAMKAFHAATNPILAWTSPSQYVGAIRDSSNPVEFLQSMLQGNSGFTTEEFNKKHPIIGTGLNLLGDALGTTGAIKAIKTVTPGKFSDIKNSYQQYRRFKSNTKKYFPSYLTKVPFDSSKESIIKQIDEEFIPKFDTNVGKTNEMYVDEILNRLSDMGIDINKPIPIYDKGQYKMVSPVEYARTTVDKPIHVGYHKSQNSPAGSYYPETDEAIIDLNQTYNDFLSSVLHERVIHPTDNIIDGLFVQGVYKPTLIYKNFLDKLFKKPSLDKNKTLKQISPDYESSKDWWELRATIGEMKKRLLLKKFYDARNNGLNPTTYEEVRPQFIEEVDKMPDEMLGIQLGFTNGYGSDYLNFRKNNPNFYNDLRNLLKYGAAYGAPVTVGAGLINNNK